MIGLPSILFWLFVLALMPLAVLMLLFFPGMVLSILQRFKSPPEIAFLFKPVPFYPVNDREMVQIIDLRDRIADSGMENDFGAIKERYRAALDRVISENTREAVDELMALRIYLRRNWASLKRHHG